MNTINFSFTSTSILSGKESMVFHSALKSSKKCNFWEDAFFCFYFDYLWESSRICGGSPVNSFAIVLFSLFSNSRSLCACVELSYIRK